MGFNECHKDTRVWSGKENMYVGLIGCSRNSKGAGSSKVAERRDTSE